MPRQQDETWRLDLGATVLSPSTVRFRVWAPRAQSVSVQVCDANRTSAALEPRDRGYYEGVLSGIGPGARYRYVLDGEKHRPDPASRWQPNGVHDASAVVDPDAFHWTDQGWQGLALDELILYELHTGTFTAAGTFEAILPHLSYLKDEVGVTAIELMPVAQFPGSRNWGYDGVYPFAPQAGYGGPAGLKTLVNACHATGLAVILDVVYNHLGPEGNYLNDFGPYFTDRYRTPWGEAVNYDGPDSDEVRHFFLSNALYWVTEYHVDGLRLDAVHGIFDFSATHMLQELAETVHAEARRLGRTVQIIAESDLNDSRLIAPATQGGYGLDAQWNDDFHHAVHAVVTGERKGYYEDFGTLEQLATAIRQGFVYAGQYSRSRRRRHGNSSEGRPARQFVVFAQNHDQIGNRAVGDRLSAQLSAEGLKVVAATVLLSPNIPLLFMGEEYGETAPFQYFVEHGDAGLVEAVRRGRRAEFGHFGWNPEDIPDPQDPATLERSRLNLDRRYMEPHAALLRWTQSLIRLRKSDLLKELGRGDAGSRRVWTYEREQVLAVRYGSGEGLAVLILLGFGKLPVSLLLQEPVGAWDLQLDAASADFGAAGRPSLPKRVVIPSQGTTVSVPAYAAGLFVRAS
jgi:maltooligosyltrehalose trehalohydrolase